MPGLRILITGATGYIGGSVLSELLNSSHPKIKESTISALVRKQEHADVLQRHGVTPVLFAGLDDLELIRKTASEHDLVLNTAISYHTASAEAILLGLADRQARTKRQTYLIQTSGTSNLADAPVTGAYIENAIFSDKYDIYSYEKYRESIEPYPQRTTDLLVADKGEQLGIKTFILMSPTIYGEGTGFFNRRSIQLNNFMRAALTDGYTSVIGAGKGEWDNVHIQDLAALYLLFVERILGGTAGELPSGKKGIYFNETGHASWLEVAQQIAKVGKELGYLATDAVREISLEEASRSVSYGLPVAFTEASFASRTRTKAVLAREIGWKPKRTAQAFKDAFADEWHSVAKSA